jgi:DNA mismatch repair protein MutS
MDRVKNYTVAIKEWNDQIIFLRRVVEGGADKSYGIQVARLAGLPAEVVRRAREVLANLEQAEFDESGEPVAAHKTGRNVVAAGLSLREGGGQEEEPPAHQLGLFASREALLAKELADMDLDAMTPLEAMNRLAELKKKAGGGA